MKVKNPLDELITRMEQRIACKESTTADYARVIRIAVDVKDGLTTEPKKVLREHKWWVKESIKRISKVISISNMKAHMILNPKLRMRLLEDVYKKYKNEYKVIWSKLSIEMKEKFFKKFSSKVKFIDFSIEERCEIIEVMEYLSFDEQKAIGLL